MAEDLRKAEFNRQLLWLFFSLLIAIFLLFLSAYIIGHGSFFYYFIGPVWMGVTAIIILAVIWIGIFALGGRWMGSLQSDWKTVSTGSRNVFVLGGLWKISMFQGLGAKRQEYLDLVAKKMARRGFLQIGKIKPSIWSPANIVLKSSEFKFESPDGMSIIGIRAVSISENLRVGFNHSGKPWQKKPHLIFLVCFILALFVSLTLHSIIKYMFPFLEVAQLATIWLITFFSILFGPLFFTGIRHNLRLNSKIKQVLTETAESMGSKQITPFKTIWVKY